MILKRLKSFTFAFNGILELLRNHPNFLVHTSMAFLVTSLAFLLSISQMEWIILILCMALVFASEAINSAIELLCDLYTLDKHPIIKKIKDISAAAVLIMAIAAAIVGSLIFYPYLSNDLF
jgi:diacylglycerol kinase